MMMSDEELKFSVDDDDEANCDRSKRLYLITFFFLALRLFLSSGFIGRIGADMILLLAWNCARRALSDNRPLAADEDSELLALFAGTFDVEFADVLLMY